jgi:hypothetical protein
VLPAGGARRIVRAVNPILLALTCFLLGCAVVLSVIGLAFTVAWLPRLLFQRRGRTLAGARRLATDG